MRKELCRTEPIAINSAEDLKNYLLSEYPKLKRVEIYERYNEGNLPDLVVCVFYNRWSLFFLDTNKLYIEMQRIIGGMLPPELGFDLVIGIH